MRVIVHFLDGGYVNVFADTIDKQDEMLNPRQLTFDFMGCCG